ncbi:Site-specific tyrosine recombinase RSp0090 [hydrothermal vent metagenome]|uniref:Site-specific tyrosine recombinase RSp0090 n=1 Tax=hydrothermal vent metagenome TaxID=652676 RepID=A0A3B0Y6E1_9ZZZZ
MLVREGKGKKDRRIPIGERALYWLDRYLTEWRPYRPRANHSNTLYITEKDFKVRDGDIGQKIRDYKALAGINKPGGCHLFRHAMATHMLDNGTDIRHIQEMLGHSHLSSTQVYTKVSNQGLKDVHRQTHPAAQLNNDNKEKTDKADTLPVLNPSGVVH